MTQPPPIKNDLPAVWDLVIEQIRKRDAFGLKKYGTRLQPFNGRNSLQDFSEELFDALVYVNQHRYEMAILGEELMELRDSLALFTDDPTAAKQLNKIIKSCPALSADVTPEEKTAYFSEVTKKSDEVDVHRRGLSFDQMVWDERGRQDAKFGPQRGKDIKVWALILAEEVGEVQKAILENYAESKSGDSPEPRPIIEELVQVAAVCRAIYQLCELLGAPPKR